MLGYNRKPLNVDREEAGNESSLCEVLGTVGILSSQHLSLLELSLLGPHGSGRTSSPCSSLHHGWAQTQAVYDLSRHLIYI